MEAGEGGVSLHGMTALHARSVRSHGGKEMGMESFACSFRIKASRSMPEIHGCKPVGQRSFREWRREGRPRSPGQVSGWGIPRRDSPATGSSKAKGRVLPGRPGPAPQALLSSTLTARGLIAPVRFSGEAAEGGSCSFTAPRPGFSSTRCFAC